MKITEFTYFFIDLDHISLRKIPLGVTLAELEINICASLCDVMTGIRQTG